MVAKGTILELEILHQTERYCVINKPSGYVVHNTPGAEDAPVVLQTLRDQLNKRIYPVHRIDRSTSGCLIMAFDPEMTSFLQRSLADAGSLKIYTLLCRGHFDAKEGRFDRPLGDEKGEKKEALTTYEVIQEFEEYSLVQARLHTGRKHQIRRHFAFERHQLVGDVNHGKGWLNRRFREVHDLHRLFLHCSMIRIRCPIEGKPVTIKCELPQELQEVLSRLLPE